MGPGDKLSHDEIQSPSHSLSSSNARTLQSISEGKCSRSMSHTSSNSLDSRDGTKKARINALKSAKVSHNKMNSGARSSSTRDHCKRIRVDLLKEGNSVPPIGKPRSTNKTKGNSLASNPVGALVASLSKCVVRTEEDAEVAMNVSLKLFKSFLDYRVNMNAGSAEKLVKAFIALISALEEHLPNVNPRQGKEGREANDKTSPKPSPTPTKVADSTTKSMEVTSSYMEKEPKKSSSQNSSGGNSSKSNPPPPPPPPEPEEDAPPPPPPPPPPALPPPKSPSNPPPPPTSVYPGTYSYPPPPFTATSPTASSPVYPQSVVGTTPPAVAQVFPPGTSTFPTPTASPYQSSGYTIPPVASPAPAFSRPPPPIIRHGFPGPGRPPFAIHPMPFSAQRPPLPPHVPYQMPGIPYPYPRLP
ncbi:uncharacterized protein [Hetaerina americana]|uniref:uncharacterized protein n=1 Tax=Hetaerina americana TaxID=62018 RepID=UPI003A7F4AD2